ncbi:MAG: hypothetical protein II886_01415 [Prevotella sp.]|nr:hypothetical protein [Prevotella sp.]
MNIGDKAPEILGKDELQRKHRHLCTHLNDVCITGNQDALRQWLNV